MNVAHILFVCTGNLCRSPMAEYLLRARLDAQRPWRVASAGTFAVEGMPASSNAITVMADLGIDLTPHRSRQLTLEQVREADLIVALSQSHREQIRLAMPGSGDKVFLLLEFDPGAKRCDVADPIGGSTQCYRETASIIQSALPGLIDFMQAYR